MAQCRAVRRSSTSSGALDHLSLACLLPTWALTATANALTTGNSTQWRTTSSVALNRLATSHPTYNGILSSTRAYARMEETLSELSARTHAMEDPSLLPEQPNYALVTMSPTTTCGELANQSTNALVENGTQSTRDATASTVHFLTGTTSSTLALLIQLATTENLSTINAHAPLLRTPLSTELCACLVTAQLASTGLLRTTLENVIAHKALTTTDLSVTIFLLATGTSLSSHAIATLASSGTLACTNAQTFLTVILVYGNHRATTARALATSTTTLWSHSVLILALPHALCSDMSRTLRVVNA